MYIYAMQKCYLVHELYRVSNQSCVGDCQSHTEQQTFNAIRVNNTTRITSRLASRVGMRLDPRVVRHLRQRHPLVRPEAEELASAPVAHHLSYRDKALSSPCADSQT